VAHRLSAEPSNPGHLPPLGAVLWGAALDCATIPNPFFTAVTASLHGLHEGPVRIEAAPSPPSPQHFLPLRAGYGTPPQIAVGFLKKL